MQVPSWNISRQRKQGFDSDRLSVVEHILQNLPRFVVSALCRKLDFGLGRVRGRYDRGR